MNQINLIEMNKLAEKARTLDRLGKTEEALAVYLEIHEKFFPNTADLYERPAILLEKLKRYEESIVILERALHLIDEGKLFTNRDNFVRRIERIKLRLNLTEVVAPPKQGIITQLKMRFSESFKRIKARKPNKDDFAAMIILLIVLALSIFSYYYQSKNNYSILMLDIEQFRQNAPSDFFLEENTVEDLPPITQFMIDIAINEASKVPGIKKIGMLVESDILGISLTLQPGTNEEAAKKATKIALESLAKEAAKTNSDLSQPNGSNFGGLFDYYYVIASVGENEKNAFLRGYKRAKSQAIIWSAN